VGALYAYDVLVRTDGPQDVKSHPGPGTPKQRVDAGNISFGVTCPLELNFASSPLVLLRQWTCIQIVMALSKQDSIQYLIMRRL